MRPACTVTSGGADLDAGAAFAAAPPPPPPPVAAPPPAPAPVRIARVRLSTQVRFYYPDASVVCRPNPQTDSFQDDPAVLFEVLARATRRIDEGEKKDAYLTIPSLAVYVLIDQEMPAVVAYRRTEHGFVREVHQGLDAVLPLGEIDTDLPLAEIYEAVEFAPEPEADMQF